MYKLFWNVIFFFFLTWEAVVQGKEARTTRYMFLLVQVSVSVSLRATMSDDREAVSARSQAWATFGQDTQSSFSVYLCVNT